MLHHLTMKNLEMITILLDNKRTKYKIKKIFFGTRFLKKNY